MKRTSYINRELIKSALENYSQSEDDIDEAVRLCSTFCRDTFGIAACAANKREISTFCATTIFFSTKRTFLDRHSGNQREFNIARDLTNELTSDCIESPPIPTIKLLRAPEKYQAHHQMNIVSYTEDIEFDADGEKKCFQGALCYSKTDEEATAAFIGNELMSIMTPLEKELIYALEGDLKPYRARQLGLRRKEAEVIIERINKKVATLDHLFFEHVDIDHLLNVSPKQTKLQIPRQNDDDDKY